jgi:hypothetical protein
MSTAINKLPEKSRSKIQDLLYDIKSGGHYFVIKADQLPQKITLNMDYYLGKVKRTITQGAVPSPSSSCPTIHPTVLTLNLFPPIVPLGGIVVPFLPIAQLITAFS